MLIRFIVNNYLSFGQETEFSLIAGQSKQLENHVEHFEEHDISVLKCSAIYGANGSGKTNIIKAIKFGRDLVVKGVRPDRAIKVAPFKLSLDGIEGTSTFEYQFLVNDQLLSYGIEVNHKKVVSEWLFEISKNSEKMLFERITSDDHKVTVSISNNFSKNLEEKQFLQFVAQGTRYNQPFLTEAKERNVPFLSDIFDWFANKLIFIFPDTRNDGILFALRQNGKKVDEVFSKYLDLFDTGILGLKATEADIESDIKLPKGLIEDMSSKLTNNKQRAFLQFDQGPCVAVYKDIETGELKAQKLMTVHKMKETGQEVFFEVNEESDGTQRVIDFIPALTRLLDGDVTILVDEIDRSLHPELTRSIFRVFGLMNSKKGQLIATTHESSLLDQDLIRRDEVWFVEKDEFGISRMYSLEDYKPRHDKDIRKDYLIGRYGAVPSVDNFIEKFKGATE